MLRSFFRKRKTLFLHVGTHKTGTTSIQVFLEKHAGELAQQGIYVPKAGRPEDCSGHHKFMWQMLEDPRIAPHDDAVGALIADLQSVDMPTVIISAEGLQFLSARPEIMKGFCSKLRALGYRIEVILFLRERESYIASLHKQHSNSGQGQSLAWYHREAARANAIRLSPIKYFDLDYRRLVRNLRRGTGGHIHVLDYDACKERGGVLPDFLKCLGANETLIEKSRSASWHNVSRRLSKLRPNHSGQVVTVPEPSVRRGEF